MGDRDTNGDALYERETPDRRFRAAVNLIGEDLVANDALAHAIAMRLAHFDEREWLRVMAEGLKTALADRTQAMNALVERTEVCARPMVFKR